MHFNFALQFELGNAAQILAQNFFLDFELILVGGVLIMAPAAAAEMWARRLDPVRRGFYDCLGLGAGEARFFFRDGGFNFFPVENKRNEYGLAASAVLMAGECICRRTGRKASESVAAVDELF